MNRYLVDGVLQDMRLGKRVVVLSETQVMARASFKDTVYLRELGNGETVRHANGRESIEAPGGGSVRFHTVRSPDYFRGMNIDVLVVDCDYYEHQADIEDIYRGSRASEVIM